MTDLLQYQYAFYQNYVIVKYKFKNLSLYRQESIANKLHIPSYILAVYS